MTYEQIINTISGTCLNHYFINSFNTGYLTDIQMGDDSPSVLYPHSFLIPGNLSGDKRGATLPLQLIVMTKTYEVEIENVKAQSEIVETLYELMGVLDNYSDDFNVLEGYTITPFKEAYKDVVVGATLNMTLRFKKPFDICNAPSTGTPSSPSECAQVLVIDGDETDHYVDAGGTYTCLPATPKSGIFYQRQIPWENNDPNVVGSVYWHVENGTYDYTPPSNPLYVASLRNGYRGSDAECFMMQPNQFGNFFRFTNDRGQQYTEGFADSPENISDDPRYCIDHLNGLGWYVQEAYVDNVNRTFVQAIDFANNFSYNGRGDWRVAGISEYLNSVNFNDYANSFGTVYCPFIDPLTRQYGGFFHSGTFTKDNQYVAMSTNSGTISLSTNPDALRGHILLVRNHYI